MSSRYARRAASSTDPVTGQRKSAPWKEDLRRRFRSRALLPPLPLVATPLALALVAPVSFVLVPALPEPELCGFPGSKAPAADTDMLTADVSGAAGGPELVWNDDGTSGRKGSLWRINSLGHFHATVGHNPPVGPFYDLAISDSWYAAADGSVVPA